MYGIRLDFKWLLQPDVAHQALFPQPNVPYQDKDLNPNVEMSKWHPFSHNRGNRVSITGFLLIWSQLEVIKRIHFYSPETGQGHCRWPWFSLFLPFFCDGMNETHRITSWRQSFTVSFSVFPTITWGANVLREWGRVSGGGADMNG